MSAKVGTCKHPGCAELTTHTYFVCTRHLNEDFGLDIKLSGTKGLGLFALRSFEKGERISQFGGELITTDELSRRYDGIFDPHWDTAPYAIGINGTRDLVRDEMRARSPAAYSNDSVDIRYVYSLVLKGYSWRSAYRKGWERDPPNSFVSRAHQLIAGRRIEQGEEITWNYGVSYWKGKNMIDLILGVSGRPSTS